MADAVIDMAGVDELPLIAELYNQIFRPSRSVESFRRRYAGRHNVLQLIARVKEAPAGFFIGFELKPETFFAWFCGVLPESRRLGIGSQLMEAAQIWALQHGYEAVRLECHNTQRPMLQLALNLGYDIVGIRWDTDRGDNLVLFEKTLANGL
jgi:GNAT superfamily N-acetyltransferase